MSASERKAVQDAVASLERTLGIEGQYEAGLIASAARIRQADAEIVVLRGALAESQARAEKAEAEVARLRAARVLPDCIKVEVPKGDPSSAFVAIMKDGGVHIGGWYRRNSDEISERLLWRLANAIALEPTR